mgnify:FL=1|tara:strand:+ start:159 stop:557 length:399 start_codon:yes stop_codon:yes gene_type:complete
MTNYTQDAVTAFHKFNDAWNDGDVETQISLMHFPHIRLSGNNDFESFKTEDDFRVAQINVPAILEAEGWHHTSTLSIDGVQSGPGKVHLVIRQSRQDEKGIEYNGFETLWIFTKIGERWGVQFRSSFLSQVN